MEIKMPQRKVQSIGYTLYVALPLVWADNANVSKGSIVEAYITENGDLIIKRKKKELFPSSTHTETFDYQSD